MFAGRNWTCMSRHNYLIGTKGQRRLLLAVMVVRGIGALG